MRNNLHVQGSNALAKVELTLVENMVENNGSRSSFDHPDLQSLKDSKFVFFGFTAAILRLWRHIIYRWEDIENTFPTVYNLPPNS
jgi:hypothetical protein